MSLFSEKRPKIRLHCDFFFESFNHKGYVKRIAQGTEKDQVEGLLSKGFVIRSKHASASLNRKFASSNNFIKNKKFQIIIAC